MRGRLRIESSSESRGANHQIIKQAIRIQNAYHPQCFDRPVRQFLDLKTHHADISSTSTIKPVLDCVSASITHKRTNSTRPSHTHRGHPQQNGKSAHIAAAAWFGFAKPKARRTSSLTVNSTGINTLGPTGVTFYQSGSTDLALGSSPYRLAPCVPATNPAIITIVKDDNHQTFGANENRNRITESHFGKLQS